MLPWILFSCQEWNCGSADAAARGGGQHPPLGGHDDACPEANKRTSSPRVAAATAPRSSSSAAARFAVLSACHWTQLSDRIRISCAETRSSSSSTSPAVADALSRKARIAHCLGFQERHLAGGDCKKLVLVATAHDALKRHGPRSGERVESSELRSLLYTANWQGRTAAAHYCKL